MADTVAFDKENSHNCRSSKVSSQKGDTAWRTTTTTRNQNKVKSHGISAQSFYAQRRPRPGSDKLAHMQEDVQNNLLKEKKRSLIEKDELKRAAFKSVTSLRTFPLQSQAFAYWRTLMREYMNDPTWGLSEEEHDEDRSASRSSSGSLPSNESSTASELSNPEPKRILRDQRQSPSQSMLKNQYRNAFLRERQLNHPLPVDFEFASPLWSMEPRIFASEKSGNDKRKYMVGHLGRFIDHYWRKADPQQRYYYELIQEGRPCHLYLDLEFSKLTNPHITEQDAEELLNELFLEIQWELAERYGIHNLDRSHVVDLDSSTPVKFSRHWIFHLPNGLVFPHTNAMRFFMNQLVSRIANDQATSQLSERPMLQKYFLVQSAPSKSNNPRDGNPSKTTCFIDTGVYTRNRLFRLMGSAKFGKSASAALRIAEANEFPFPEGFSNAGFYIPAMAPPSLSRPAKALDSAPKTRTIHDPLLESVESKVDQFIAATDWSKHAEALAQTLVVPLNASKMEYSLLPFDESEDIAFRSKSSGSSPRNFVSPSSMSMGPSPYPSIDRFVLDHLANRGGVQGSIRAWSLTYATSPSGGTTNTPAYLNFQMSRNRWCECIGRPHRSNNIVWMVDLQLWRCVQSCHDPECRALGFRGTPVPLPDDICQAVSDQIFEEQLEDFDEVQFIVDHRRQQGQQPGAGGEEAGFSSTENEPGKEFPVLGDDDDSFEAALCALSLEPRGTVLIGPSKSSDDFARDHHSTTSSLSTHSSTLSRRDCSSPSSDHEVAKTKDIGAPAACAGAPRETKAELRLYSSPTREAARSDADDESDDDIDLTMLVLSQTMENDQPKGVDDDVRKSSFGRAETKGGEIAAIHLPKSHQDTTHVDTTNIDTNRRESDDFDLTVLLSQTFDDGNQKDYTEDRSANTAKNEDSEDDIDLTTLL